MIKNIWRKTLAVLLLAGCITPLPLLGATQTTPIALQRELAALTSYLERIGQEGDPSLLKKLTSEEIDEIIDKSVMWLIHAQEQNGHFKYEYVPYEDTYRDDDNIVRQAGALHALGEIARRDTAGVYDLKTTMRRAVRYFESMSEEGTYNGKEFRCIVDGVGSHACKLGATSLALTGILGFMQRYPEYTRTYDSLIGDYVNFILAIKTEKKGFRNVFNTTKIQQSDKESSFSNGEALLALVRYNQFKPNKKIKEVIDETFQYLESRVPFDTALYLWAMAAIKDLHEQAPDEEYFKYVQAYTDWRIQSVAHLRNTPHNLCAYMEGIVSVYSILTSRLSGAELSKYEDEINRWLSKSSQLQIADTDRIRVLVEPALVFKSLPRPEQSLGGFLTGSNELTQRIDFTQHCVSSYVQKLIDIDKSHFLED